MATPRPKRRRARFSIEAARQRRAMKARALSDLAEGRLSLDEALTAAPLASADIYEVLLRCPGLGRESVRTVCERAGVWPHVRMSDLTEHERAAVLRVLPARTRRQ